MTDPDLHPALLHHIVNTLEWPGLRPLQNEAIGPLRRGADALLLAPTAGGKTEAAIFPILTRMEDEGWQGLSVLYVCPLRALLNNLEPRLQTYAGWLGRRADLWHGDTGQGKRQRMLKSPPDVLLTTPESLEAMLISTRVNPHEQFANVQAIIVDEVHAFAGDDRGWHLLAVLERLQHLAGHPIQRIGLSATVGNPQELLTWLQGSSEGLRPRSVVAPEQVEPGGRPPGEITLDHVGSLENAAKVISLLHLGEKRLVFCESRRDVEDLSHALRLRGVTTFVSHSSLSADERRQAEQAFGEARDCVIVSTSTLELGIDVGDLDRVIQINAPRSVASLLQRLGRTGRRPGSTRNALFLTTTDEGLLRAAALLLLWARGYVEAVTPPPSPNHIAAQQLLALCLQEGRVGANVRSSWWNGLSIFDEQSDEIVQWLIQSSHLESDGGMLSLGPESERRFGRRNFMELTSVFTASPEFLVLEGRRELGSVDPLVLTRKTEEPRIVVLAGRSWRVTYIDWKRHRCYVEPSDIHIPMRWSSDPAPLSYALCRAERDVVLGDSPEVGVSRRASEALSILREDRAAAVSPLGLLLLHDGDDVHWWTWAGARANAVLIAALPLIADQSQRIDNLRIRLQGPNAASKLSTALNNTTLADARPLTNSAALDGLKFSEVLPTSLAVRTLSDRMTDLPGAEATASFDRVSRSVDEAQNDPRD